MGLVDLYFIIKHELKNITDDRQMGLTKNIRFNINFYCLYAVDYHGQYYRA